MAVTSVRTPVCFLSIALVFPLVVVACGGGQTPGAAFDPGWRDDAGVRFAARARAFRDTPVPRGADVAVGVAGPTTLVGVSLAGGTPWTFEHALACRPAVAGTVVVGLGAGELFALDARTGALLWQRRAGGLLRGAGDDGAITVVSLLPTTGRGSLVLAVDRAGNVLRQLEDGAAIGTPAIVDAQAFLPWGGRFVSVLDLGAGEETARWTVRARVSAAFVVGGVVFFGEGGATPFDDRLDVGAKGHAVELPARDLPGSPQWMQSGTEPLSIEARPSDTIRLYARPTTRGALGVDGGRYAATYHRIVAGLDASSGALVWARVHEADFLGGAAYEGGFALCDARGAVHFFESATGGQASEIALGRAVTACIVQVDGLAKPTVKIPSKIDDEILRAVSVRDPKLVPMQGFLRSELAGRR